MYVYWYNENGVGELQNNETFLNESDKKMRWTISTDTLLEEIWPTKLF